MAADLSEYRRGLLACRVPPMVLMVAAAPWEAVTWPTNQVQIKDAVYSALNHLNPVAFKNEYYRQTAGIF